MIAIDSGKFRQILVNLLGNAAKFTFAGSIEASVSSPSEGRLAIAVQDTGIGIPPQDQGRLFQPFERTAHGENSAGGTGLGLAISRQYARLMGGEILLCSTPGQGSVFTLELPFGAPDASASAASPIDAPAGMRVEPSQGRILVVDDIEENRQVLRLILEPMGFVVHEARGGKESIAMVDRLRPQVVLMDLRMPDLDGKEATRILREHHPKGGLVIIGVSASALDEEQRSFLRSGLDAFLSKPVRVRELQETLSRFVVFCQTDPDTTPSVENAPSSWCEAFRNALRSGSTTRLAALAAQADSFSPALGRWLDVRVSNYRLDELKALARTLPERSTP